MELSKRLNSIVKHMDKCEKMADIGSDHGYIPIYAVKNNICRRAIASDINKGPVEKARMDAMFEGVSDFVDVRLGAGLKTIRKGEVNSIVIAGMGGNLIRDILEADISKVKELDYMILLPAQNPEVLRKYLYNTGYEILTEDICEDEGIYYEIFKVRYSTENKLVIDDIFYEISPILLREKNPMMKEYLEVKREKLEKILGFIKEDTESANNRKKEISSKIEFIDKSINEV